MKKIADEFLDSRPQRLCHMCGKCCRVSVTSKTYQELLALVEEGDEGAKDFLKVFEPYSSIDAAREVSRETVDNILLHLKDDEAFDENKVTFYRCRYIQDDNLCSIYKERPELCDRFPSSAWAVVPPKCGFEGWLFQKREEIKQKIRKQKENILTLEAMLNEAQTPEQTEKIKDLIEKTKKTIGLYSNHGSEYW